MDGFEGGGGIIHTSNPRDLKRFGMNSTGDAVFDASQYAFFGNDVVQEVELGGLDDEEDDLPPVGLDSEEYLGDQEEGELLRSCSDIDDLDRTFSKLNKVVVGSKSARVIGDRGSRESLAAAEWSQEADFSSWLDQRAYDAESTQESKRWSSQPYASLAHVAESKSLYRTSSYPEQQQQHQQQHFSSEPILIPKSSFTSYPPPGGRSLQASPNQSHPNIPYHPGGHHMPISSPNVSPLSNPQLQLNALPRGSQVGGNMASFSHPGLNVNGRMQDQWVDQRSLYPGENSNLSSSMLQQQIPQQNDIIPPQLLPQQHSHQQRLHHPFQSSIGHLSGLQPQLYNLPLPSPVMNNYDLLGLPDLRDQRAKLIPKARQDLRCYYQSSDASGLRSDSGWPQFKSKYMSPDEIENILRMQLVATHSNDPYVDDYYHQACLAKKNAGAKLKHHFCPTHLRDSPSRARADTEPHPFLKVDALGRVSFSSIRRPRPLLEVNSPSSTGTCCTEQKISEKPLEQEPMLAARVMIEDGLCLLLDVDDIDRYLQFNQLQDGGVQLRQRRQVLLEGLAVSLQLVDPLVKNGHTVDMAPKDDLVFLRLVSLPKGRMLLSRYIQLLLQGGELIRVVCMAIFRHLRFLFGGLPADEAAAESTGLLATAVSSCICGMELKGLAACLASVVCSAEHPPLHPIGSSAGDGASMIMKSVLERATELLTDPHAAGSCSMSNCAFWQASFDAFFNLLTKYCFNKYDTIMQSLVTHVQADIALIGSDAARAIRKEMPVELLRASLPHTSELQRKLLLDFAHRSVPVLGFDGHSEENGGP